MTLAEAREIVRAGYYGNVLEDEEILGMAVEWFPEVNRDQDIEEIVAEICFG